MSDLIFHFPFTYLLPKYMASTRRTNSAFLQNWENGNHQITYVKESACQCRRHKRCGFDPWVRKIPWKRKPTPFFLPGESHGKRSNVSLCMFVGREEGARMYRERKLSNNYLHNEYRIFKSNKNQVIKRNKNNHGIYKCQMIGQNHILLKINMDLTFLEFF